MIKNLFGKDMLCQGAMVQDQLVKDQGKGQIRAKAWGVARVEAGGSSGNCVSPNCGATVPNVA